MRLIFLFLLQLQILLGQNNDPTGNTAQPPRQMTPEQEAKELEESLANFKVEHVIHPTIRDLPEPTFWDNITGQKLPITSSSEKAQKHVQQGMAHLTASWDYEAYRHFAAAAKEDPDCLMAYWGITMALGGSSNEFRDEMRHALDRMLVLIQVNADRNGHENNQIGSAIERGYAYATGNLIANGPFATSRLFDELSKNYPNDIQSKMWSIFFSRDGYHKSGEPRLRQKKAVQALRSLLLRHHQNQLLTAFWLTTIAEMPNSQNQLQDEALPAARTLARDTPNYPIFQHLAGHFEYRCGNAKRAIHYFKNAILLYENHMKANRIDYHDCPGWVRTKMYLAAAYHTKGNYAAANTIFAELSALKIKKDRIFSPGASLLMWDARSMAARYAIGTGTKDDFNTGVKCLTTLLNDQWYPKESSSGLYQQALIYYTIGRKALLVKDVTSAKKALKDLSLSSQKLGSIKSQQNLLPTFNNWKRAINTLAILHQDLQGRIALQETGATRTAAVVWFQTALTRETLPSLLMPPNLPIPMEANLAQYYHNEKKYPRALQNYTQALQKSPNNINILKPYHLTLLKMKDTDRAARVAQRIQQVQK